MPQYLSHINLNQNELQNAVVQRLATAPSNPTEGQVYFDTTLDKLGVYNGVTWTYMGDAEGGQFVDLTTNQTVGGVKTFTSFPVTPSAAPTTNYQVANKKYVDDSIQNAGGYTDKLAQDAVGGILTDTATVDFDYDSGASEITASVLDSPLLQGQNGAYYLDRTNHTGTQSADTIVDGTNNKVFTSTDKTKLDYITATQAVNLDDLQQAVDGLEAAVVLKGTWDASSGSFPTGTNSGWSYIVSVGGTVDGITFDVNDRIVAITDGASSSTYAGNWFKLDYTDSVLSVNGNTGAVVLDTSDVDDTTDRRYVTDAQRTVLSNTSGVNTGDEPAASTTVQGVVELATTAETNAKTDTERAVTPAGLATFTRKYTATIGNGSSTSIAVTHGLGSQFVTAQVFEVSSNEMVMCDVVLTSSTVTTFNFSQAPASDSLRVVIVG